MFVGEVMTSPAVTVRDDETVQRAARLLLDHRIASMPVVDGSGALVGVVSEADLIRRRTPPDPRAHLRALPADDGEDLPATVGDVMSRRPLAVQVRSDASDASRILLDHGIKAVPVVDGQRVVGVLARRDLLRHMARDDADVRADVLALLADLTGGGPWEAVVHDGTVVLRGEHEPRLRRLATVLVRTVPGVARVVLTDEPVPGAPAVPPAP